jgi:hypothetical protein
VRVNFTSLVDRVDAQHGGLAVGDGVDLPDHPLTVDSRACWR